MDIPLSWNLFQWHSLKTRVTIFTLEIFVISIWSLAFYASRMLREIRADLPVVLASGYITEELRAEAPAAGVSELIYKPNTVDDLCEAVARYANAPA